MKRIVVRRFLLVFVLLLTLTLAHEDSQGEAGEDECDEKCGKIIGIIFASIFGAPILVLLVYCCYKGSKGCLTRHSLSKQYHQQKIDTRPIEEFTAHVSYFKQILNQTKKGKLQFEYEQQRFGSKTKKIATLSSVEVKRKDDHEYAVQMEGDDFYGYWQGQGRLIDTQNGPFFWMFKQYGFKQIAGQTGEYHTLVYESTHLEKQVLRGKWFFHGFQDSIQHSGLWKIENIHQRSSKPEAPKALSKLSTLQVTMSSELLQTKESATPI